jgi:hypothetical protein
LKSVCFAPLDTRIWLRSYVSPFSRETAPDGSDAGFGDVRGSVEVGLADRHAEHVLALGAQLRSARGHGEGRRGLDALYASRKKRIH